MFNNFYNNCEKLIRTFSRLAQNYNRLCEISLKLIKKHEKPKKRF